MISRNFAQKQCYKIFVDSTLCILRILRFFLSKIPWKKYLNVVFPQYTIAIMSTKHSEEKRYICICSRVKKISSKHHTVFCKRKVDFTKFLRKKWCEWVNDCMMCKTILSIIWRKNLHRIDLNAIHESRICAL